MNEQIFLGKYLPSGPSESASFRSAAGGVYRGVESATGRAVNLEIVPGDTLSDAVREQLAAEVAVAKQLDHPNIPALYDFGVEDGNLIYVTEDLDGTTLENWISEQGPLDAGAGLRLSLQILSALGAAAYHGILHHAINPRNVLIVPGQATDGGWPKVKLLHLIGLAPASVSSAGVSDNSASFASPEQLQTGAVDFRSEIYSLGCTLFFALTGTISFQNSGETPDARLTATRRAIERLRGLPREGRRLLAQMLSSNPDERPLDPLATHGILQECLAQVEQSGARTRKLGIPPAIAPPLPVGASAARFPRKLIAIGAILLLCVGLAAAVLPGLLRRSANRTRTAQPEEIGVPVGVPERSASPAEIVRMEPTPASNDAENRTAAEPETLISTVASPTPAELVAESTPAAPIVPPTIEPPPQPAVVQQEVASPPPEQPTRAEPAATSPPRESAEKGMRVRRAEPVTDADLPRLPCGTVRAKYLGTDANGQLLLGLPSDKQGTVTLPSEETSSRTKRSRRTRRAEPIEEPTPRVLRALPPDE